MAQQSIETLIAQTRSPDPHRQVDAILALADRDATEATPMVTRLLTSPDPSVRFTAVGALGRLARYASSTAGPEVMRLLTDPEVIVRSEAIDVLGLLRYVPALEAVRAAVRTDTEPLVRASAAETLGDLGDPQVIPDLQHAIRDSDEAVRGYAADALGKLGTPELLPGLMAAYDKESASRVRGEILGARCRLGERVFPLFLDMLERSDEDLASTLLNILVDLLEHRRSAHVLEDAPRTLAILDDMDARFPLLRGHTGEARRLLTDQKEDEPTSA
jgi:HEAT repeat protein